MRIFLLACLMFGMGVIQAQKVDIDNHNIKLEYAIFPESHVPSEERTYMVELEGDGRYDLQAIDDQIHINGWTRVEEGATVKVHANLKDFVKGRSSLDKNVKENKNKDGKVISRTTTYTVASTDRGVGILKLYGPVKKYEKPKKKKKNKKKKKRKSKKEKEKEEAAANPFLAGIDSSDEAEEAEMELAKSYDVSQGYTYRTRAYKSSRLAYDEFNSNSDINYENHFVKYQDNVGSYINNALNIFYGFRPKEKSVRFKRLDSDKHPEFEMFENAMKAIKVILGKKKFNTDINETREALAPIMEYFETVRKKYKKDDKHPKRLKAAAMYNLATLHYYLGQPDECIAIGKAYIRWDHDKGDGEDFVEMGEELKHLLAFYETDGRYCVEQE